MQLIYFYLFLRATNVKLPAVKACEDVAKFIFLRTEFLSAGNRDNPPLGRLFSNASSTSDINQGCNIKNKSLIRDDVLKKKTIAKGI